MIAQTSPGYHAGMTVEAVLFDLDDTLSRRVVPTDWDAVTVLQAAALAPHCARLGYGHLDLEAVVRHFWNAFSDRYPEPDLFPDLPLEERRWLDGPAALREIVAELSLVCGDEDAACLWAALNDVPFRVQYHHLYPDAISTVQVLSSAGFRLAVATARPLSAAIVSQELRDQGMPELFDAVVTSGEVGYRKPHPEVFATAARLLDVEPVRVVVVGDSYESDITPAASLGMIPVLKLNERAPDRRWTLARAQVPSLAALLDLDVLRRG
jgi:putative hydrolase of the HAD superfamily